MKTKNKEFDINKEIRDFINKIQSNGKIHRINVEVDFVDFSYNRQELIKPNRINEIGDYDENQK